MRANDLFLRQGKEFWAYVRILSQEIGYTNSDSQVKVPTIREVAQALRSLDLVTTQVCDDKDRPTKLGENLLAYFQHRAEALNAYVEPLLMDRGRARAEFERLKKELNPRCPLPMNKQKGKKRGPAYLTGIVNMLIERHSHGLPCNYDPRQLTMVTRDRAPLRTMARRVDGAFPGATDPIAVWEIKEYYNTTTFGSRVADGVYETLLDGMELEELSEHEGIHIRHYLIIDDRFTWWDCGKSYLCRVIDMLHMGYVDEVLFGLEVLKRLPKLVQEWVAAARAAK